MLIRAVVPWDVVMGAWLAATQHANKRCNVKWGCSVVQVVGLSTILFPKLDSAPLVHCDAGSRHFAAFLNLRLMASGTEGGTSPSPCRPYMSVVR